MTAADYAPDHLEYFSKMPQFKVDFISHQGTSENAQFAVNRIFYEVSGETPFIQFEYRGLKPYKLYRLFFLTKDDGEIYLDAGEPLPDVCEGLLPIQVYRAAHNQDRAFRTELMQFQAALEKRVFGKQVSW